MNIDLTKLECRDLTQPELAQLDSVLPIVTWLTEKLTGLEPGQGREIGPFESENDARNFNSSYTSKAAKALGWGLPEQDGHVNRYNARTKSQVRPRDEKFYLWIVRRA